MAVERERAPRLPPRWFIRVAWAVHRAIYRLTGGRKGLGPPKGGRWGTMHLKTIGRRTGRERSAGTVDQTEVRIDERACVQGHSAVLVVVELVGEFQCIGHECQRGDRLAVVPLDEGEVEQDLPARYVVAPLPCLPIGRIVDRPGGLVVASGIPCSASPI